MEAAVELVAGHLVPDRWHEAPRAVVGPLHLRRCPFGGRHQRTHEARLRDQDLHRQAPAGERVAVAGEGAPRGRPAPERRRAGSRCDPPSRPVARPTDGAAVWFLFDTDVGPGPCPPSLGGVCVDLPTPSLLGVATADGNGDATYDFVLPMLAPLVEIDVQAVQPAGADTRISGTSGVQIVP